MKSGRSTRTIRRPVLARPKFKPRGNAWLASRADFMWRLSRAAHDAFAFCEARPLAVGSMMGVSVIGLSILFAASGGDTTRISHTATPPPSTQRAETVRPAGDEQFQILYSPSVNLEAADTKLIDSAKSTLNVAAYSLTDDEIIEAFLRANQRGVRVRIVLDRSELHSDRGLEELADEIRVKRAGSLMHLKAYSVDGHVFRTGSANLSRRGLLSQNNDVVVIRDSQAVAGFDHNFQDIWSAAEPLDDMAAEREKGNP